MEIEMPRDWSILIRNIHRKGGIKVIDMIQDDFYNVSVLQKSCFINRKKNTEGEQMSFIKANYFRYTGQNPGNFFYKTRFSEEEEFKVWDIMKKKKGQSSEVFPTLEKLHTSYPFPVQKKIGRY